MLHQPKTKIPAARPFRPFVPGARGDLGRALASRKSFETIAPESPRPSEMLSEVAFSGRDRLTADDEALHQVLVSRAYESDPSMSADMHSMEMAEAIVCLGSRVERSDVRASLARLKTTTVSYGHPGGRRYEDVPFLEGWIEVGPDSDTIRYRLPEPLRELMRDQRSGYAYVELTAFPRMKSKFSSRLYKRFALLARQSPWKAGESNAVTIRATPDEIAAWVGFPVGRDGRVHGGKLKDRVLDKLGHDFRDVRAFSLDVRLDHGGRGNALRGVDFTIRVAPPAHHTVPMTFDPCKDRVRVGAKDVAEYRVESRTWRRAAVTFGKALGMINRQLADFWQLALNEALTGEPLSDGYATRRYRGDSLLSEIAARGADAAAWGFLGEEAAEPDLAARRTKDRETFLEAERAAEKARYDRIDFGKRQKKTSASSSRKAEVPEVPAAQPAQAAAEPEVVALTFETCREILLTLDPAVNVHDMRGIVVPAIKSWQYTGDRLVTLTVRYVVGGGCYDRYRVGCYTLSEDDLDGLLKRLWRYIDGEEEYL